MLHLLRFKAFAYPLIRFAVILFAVIAVYFQDLNLVLVDSLQYEGYSYILVIPVIVAYLLYRKRHMLAATVLDENKTHAPRASENTKYLPKLAGVLLCLTALTMYVFGSQTFSPLQYHLISMPLFAAGLTLILFDLVTLRQAIFPIVFLIFLTPPPVVFLNNVGSLLSAGSTETANALANVLGVNSWVSTVSGARAINLVNSGSQPLSFVVDIACSGVYSLVGFAVFVTFLAYIVRDKIWKKFAIVTLGVPLIYFLNTIRITTIVLIGYQWGADLALQLFHAMGGWVLIFLGTLLLLIIAEKIFKTQIFTKANMKSRTSKAQDSKAGIAAPLMKRLGQSRKRMQAIDAIKIATIIIVALTIVYIQSPVFSLTRGPAPIMIETASGQQGNTALFPQIEDYTLRFNYRDTDFEKLSGQNYSLAFTYNPQQSGDPRVEVSLEVAESTVSLHLWEVCLINWATRKGEQPVTSLDLRDLSIQEDPPVVARYFAFKEQDQNQIQLVLYYFTTGLFEIDKTYQTKQVKISFITYFSDPNDLQTMENKLLPFAESTVKYWEPLRKVNTVTAAMLRNIVPMAAVSPSALIALLPFSWIQTRRRLKTNASVYQKLHPYMQRIVDAVQEAEKNNPATIENIAETYQKMMTHPANSYEHLKNLASIKELGLPAGRDELLRNLGELEELGLTRKTIMSVQDEPVYTWKTQFQAR